MINYFLHKDIDKQKWDACLTHSQNGFIFAYSWYLDIVCSGWDALVEDDYKTIFPLPWKKKWGIPYLFQPYFLNQLGAFSALTVSSEKLNEFFAQIPEKFKYIDMALNFKNIPQNHTVATEKKTVQYIDLSMGYDTIASAYSENLKRNLKKAAKNKLRTEKNVSPKEVVKSFRKAQGKALKEFGAAEYKKLLALMEKLSSEKMGETLGVFTPGDNLCASAFFMQSHNRIIYLKGGADETGRRTGAMHLLMDAVLRENSGRNLIFDFGGSNAPSVARFNKNFGAKEYVYLRIRKNNLPKIIRWVK